MSNLVPVEININDDGKFADMAYFFDYKRALTEINNARQTWTGGEIIPNSQTEAYVTQPSGKDLVKHYECMQFGRIIAKKFHKPATYIRPITAAILSGEITDADYSTIITVDTFQFYGIPNDLRLNNRIAILSDRVRACDLPNIDSDDDKSIASVRLHRRWFLMQQYGGLGLRRIAALERTPISTVQSAVTSYKYRVYQSYRRSFENVMGLRDKK